MSRNQKGSKGELQVVRLIEPWWQQLEPGARFIRTPKSGGWTHAGIFQARGDVMVDRETTKRFPFSVEVKRREAWSMRELIAGRRSPVWSWWRQTQKAATEDGLEPMLWFRRNRAPWLVMLRFGFVSGLRGMPAPFVAWVRGELLVQHGDHVGAHPCVYRADSLLAVPPAVLAVPPAVLAVPPAVLAVPCSSSGAQEL